MPRINVISEASSRTSNVEKTNDIAVWAGVREVKEAVARPFSHTDGKEQRRDGGRQDIGV